MRIFVAIISAAALTCVVDISPNVRANDEQTIVETCPYRVHGQLDTIRDPQANILDRVQAIHDFNDNLRPADIDVLYAFLKSHQPEQDVNGVHYLKNEVLNKLRSQATAPKNLTATMLAIFYDRQQDDTTRDYAVQHLASWYENGAEDAQGAKQKIREVLLAAAHEKTVLGATALLSAHELSRSFPADFDSKVIDNLALQLATASESTVPSRVTAFQVCAERQIAAAVPAMEFAVLNSGDVILRRSAISSLRTLHDIPRGFALRQTSSEEQISLNKLAPNRTETTRTSLAQ